MSAYRVLLCAPAKLAVDVHCDEDDIEQDARTAARKMTDAQLAQAVRDALEVGEVELDEVLNVSQAQADDDAVSEYLDETAGLT